MSDFIKQNAIKNTFKVGDSWAILSEIEQSIKTKIEMVGTPLRDWGIKINYGIKTGCNEAFIIDDLKRNEILSKCASEDEKIRTDKIIRPILRGRDINRDGYKWAGLYLIVMHNGYSKNTGAVVPRININSYPSLKSWFDNGNWNKKESETNIERLSNRTDKGETLYNLRDCAYMDDFSKQKIIWSDISTEPNFLFNDEEIYFNNTCYMIIGAPEWVINYLNSDIIRWYFPKVIASDLGAGTRYFKQFVEMIPVPKEYNSETFYLDIGLSDEEIKFISSSVNS